MRLKHNKINKNKSNFVLMFCERNIHWVSTNSYDPRGGLNSHQCVRGLFKLWKEKIEWYNKFVFFYLFKLQCRVSYWCYLFHLFEQLISIWIWPLFLGNNTIVCILFDFTPYLVGVGTRVWGIFNLVDTLDAYKYMLHFVAYVFIYTTRTYDIH